MSEFPNRELREGISRWSGRRSAGRDRTGHEEGFIVVAVLWILAVLATLVSIYAVYVANAAVSLSVNDDRLQSEALVSAALDLTAYQLSAGNQNSAPARGQFAFRMGRSSVTVEFRPESARIDLNTAPKQLLAGLFVSLGASSDDAAYYADRVVAWRSKPADSEINSEADAYRTAGLSYTPRQAPFANTGELWLVLGLPPVLVARALPFVTVFSGQATVDVLDAAPQIIAALPGMSPDRLDALLKQRAAATDNPQSVLGLLGPAQGSISTDASKTARVDVDIAFDSGRRVGAEAVILPLKDAEQPYRVLYWRDDFDGGA